VGGGYCTGRGRGRQFYDDTTTAEKYAALAKTNYKFSESDYVFGVVKYETDRFSGYDYQASESIGYGRRVVKTEAVILDLELGAGARQSETEAGDANNEGIVRAAGNISWAISPTAVFTEQLTVEAGNDATITTSVTALKRA
jgi:putative salt-induced outer membrane protein